MLKHTCKSCRWFQKTNPPPGEVRVLHACFFNPPINMAMPQPGGVGIMPMRPIVNEVDGCHNHTDLVGVVIN